MSKFFELINSDQIVLLDFSAEWCEPCKMLAPILKEVKEKIGEKVTILKIDIDKNPKIATSYQIQSVPTLMIFRQGEIKWRESGVKPVHELIELINKYM